MGKNKSILATALAAVCFGILILDSKTALAGATDGILLCINTVVPALFPFFLISALLTAGLTGHSGRLLTPIERILGIPKGCVSLFLVGVLSGYPVGARSICQAYENGQLQKDEAKRMLGFCNNAGPAFLFGMCGRLFSSPWIPWVLWMLQIISAVSVACIFPGKSTRSITLAQKDITLQQAMNISVKTMGQVCGWVVLFRVMITFFQRWFFFFLPQDIQFCLTGFLELSNGCICLQQISSEGLRFILCGSFLAFGGICVGMQTASVTQAIGTGLYFPGKMIQLMICFILSLLLQPILFSKEQYTHFSPAVIVICLCFTAVFVVYVRKQENKGSNLTAFPV